jgi:hypothetical protein
LRAHLVLANGVSCTVVYGGVEADVLVATDDHIVSVLDFVRAEIVDMSGGNVEGKGRSKRGREALAPDLRSLATADVRARLEEGKAVLA